MIGSGQLPCAFPDGALGVCQDWCVWYEDIFHRGPAPACLQDVVTGLYQDAHQPGVEFFCVRHFRGILAGFQNGCGYGIKKEADVLYTTALRANCDIGGCCIRAAALGPAQSSGSSRPRLPSVRWYSTQVAPVSLLMNTKKVWPSMAIWSTASSMLMGLVG